MIFLATPQRTAVIRLVAPTPTIAPVTVWVVLTCMPGIIMSQKESGMFQDDTFNDVCDILTDIYGLFYPLKYFFPLDELDGIFFLLK